MLSARKTIISADQRRHSLEYGDLEEKIIYKYSLEHNHKYEFHVRSNKMVDNILEVLTKNFKDDPHFNDIYAHFNGFGSKVLDQYSEFIVVIPMYGSRIRFVSSRMEYSGMEYMLNDWHSKPAKQFQKRSKFLGIF